MEKQILQTATVVGMDVPLSLLRAISGFSEEELLHGMKNLVAGEYFYETSLFPEHTYTFKHALTHEVAYGSLLQSRRKRIHADILSAIESGAGDRLEEQWERLGHHAWSGEMWEKAVLYYSRAGKKAMDRSAHREAVHFFEEALAALKKLPSAAGSDEAAIDLRFGLRNSLVSLGRFDRVPEYLNEAGDLAARIGDDSRRGWASCYFAQYYWTVGNLEQAVESGLRASSIAKSAGDFSLAVATNFYLGLAYHTQGEYLKAGRILAENVSSIEGEHRYDRFDLAYLPSVASMAWLAWSLAEVGEFSEGAEISGQAVQIAEKVGQPYSLTMAFLGAGTLCLRKGDLEKAVSHLEQALDHYSRNEVPIWYFVTASHLGYALVLSGKEAEGHELLEQSVAKTDSGVFQSSQSLRISWLAEANLRMGNLESAKEHADHALDLARGQKERGNEAWALRLHGEVHSHPDALGAEKAEDHYRQALALAGELGMRPLIAHCRGGLGALYGRTGQEDKARAELTAAMDMYREMGMTFWLERAEEALAEDLS